MRDEQLRIYLNDHLAASVGASELARRMARENAGSSLAELLNGVLEDLDSERALLGQLVEAIGGRQNPFKQAGLWTIAKLGRLKLNGRLVGYSPLSRLLELEVLLGSVGGKALLWRSLRDLSSEDRRLALADFSRLAERAARQTAALEDERLRAVQRAFN